MGIPGTVLMSVVLICCACGPPAEGNAPGRSATLTPREYVLEYVRIYADAYRDGYAAADLLAPWVAGEAVDLEAYEAEWADIRSRADDARARFAAVPVPEDPRCREFLEIAQQAPDALPLLEAVLDVIRESNPGTPEQIESVRQRLLESDYVTRRADWKTRIGQAAEACGVDWSASFEAEDL